MKKIAFTYLLFCCVSAAATELIITPLQDNTIYETSNEPLSNGAGQYLFAGRVAPMGDGLTRRALVKFDISVIPEGTTINSASVELYVSKKLTAGPISLHLTTSDWGEGTSNAGGEEGGGTAATLNDATWVSAFNGDDENGGTSWLTVGGDFAVSASATTAAPAVSSPSNGVIISFNNPNLTADIENWINGTNENHGWFILGDESITTTAARFNSRENTANQPSLILDIELPNLIFSNGFEPLN